MFGMDRLAKSWIHCAFLTELPLVSNTILLQKSSRLLVGELTGSSRATDLKLGTDYHRDHQRYPKERQQSPFEGAQTVRSIKRKIITVIGTLWIQVRPWVHDGQMVQIIKSVPNKRCAPIWVCDAWFIKYGPQKSELDCGAWTNLRLRATIMIHKRILKTRFTG